VETPEAIRHAGKEDEAPFAELKALLDEQLRERQPEGERTLRIGSAGVRVAYAGESARRYVEEHARLYWTDAAPLVTVRVVSCDAFPVGRVRESTLWQGDGQAHLGRWDFFIELDAASHSARAVVAPAAEFVSVDSAVRVAIGAFVAPEHCVLLHGMASVRDGVGVIGSALGRGGKSTSARLLRAQGWTTLCDDLPAIHEEKREFIVSGTPFWSCREEDFHTDRFTTERVPLRAVFLLEKGRTVEVIPCERPQATATLMRNVLHYPMEEALGVAKLECVLRLVGRVPVFRLSFLRDELPEDVILKQVHQ